MHRYLASGLVLSLASASCYGANIAFARQASFVGISGSDLVTYRVVLILMGALAVAGWMKQSLKPYGSENGSLLFMGLTTASVGLCYLSSVTFIPVNVAVVIFYTFPALITLAAPFVEKSRLDLTRLSLVAVAMLGVIAVVGPVFDGLDPRGLILAALASVSATMQFFAAARCQQTPTATKIIWIHLIVLPVALLIGLSTGTLNPPSHLLNAPLAVFLTMLGYIIAFVLQLQALTRTSAVIAGLAFCAEPVVAAATSSWVLGERLSLLQAGGATLVIAAIGLNIIVEHHREIKNRKATLSS